MVITTSDGNGLSKYSTQSRSGTHRPSCWPVDPKNHGEALVKMEGVCVASCC